MGPKTKQAAPTPQPSGQHVDPRSPPALQQRKWVGEGDPRWMNDKDAPNCLQCKSKFSFIKRRHHCRMCGRIFCDSCCKFSQSHGGERVCSLCLEEERIQAEEARKRAEEEALREAERQAKLKAIARDIANCQVSEEKERAMIEDPRDKQIEKLLKIFDKTKKKLLDEEARKREEEKKAKKAEEKGGVMDHWTATHGPRSGSLSLTVARCQNLVPAKLFLTVNSAVLVQCPYADALRPVLEFESDVVKLDGSPEFDFETYCQVEDDTLPIMFTVRDWTVGYPRMIGQSRLDLRGEYKNLVRTVSAEGVYTEKGHAILDMWKRDKLLPDSTITVHWTFELREVNKTKFCPDCGRLEMKCQCSEEKRNARRAEEAKQREAKIHEEMAAKEARLDAERKKKEEEEEKRRVAAEKAFKAGVADLEVVREKQYVDLKVGEHRAWEKIEKALRESYHIVRVKEEWGKEQKRQVNTCLAILADNTEALRANRFGTWQSYVFLKNEILRTKAEERKAAAALAAERQKDNEEKDRAEAEARQREKEKQEQKYQDEALGENEHMLESGRPRGEIHHDEKKREQIEEKQQQKAEGGCCCVVS